MVEEAKRRRIWAPFYACRWYVVVPRPTKMPPIRGEVFRAPHLINGIWTRYRPDKVTWQYTKMKDGRFFRISIKWHFCMKSSPCQCPYVKGQHSSEILESDAVIPTTASLLNVVLFLLEASWRSGSRRPSFGLPRPTIPVTSSSFLRKVRTSLRLWSLNRSECAWECFNRN